MLRERIKPELAIDGGITESYLKLSTPINHSLYTTGNRSKPKLKFEIKRIPNQPLSHFRTVIRGYHYLARYFEPKQDLSR